MKREREGFTLLELMIVLALAAILAGVAVPAMNRLVTYGHRATELNRLVASLRYARSEAVTRGLTVSLCTSPDGRHCSTHADWDKGWIVFVDRNSNLDREKSENILRVGPPFNGNDRLVGNTRVDHRLGYRRNGFLRGVHNGTITFSTAPPDQALRRCLVISRTGRIRMETGSEPHCAAQRP